MKAPLHAKENATLDDYSQNFFFAKYYAHMHPKSFYFSLEYSPHFLHDHHNMCTT